MPQSIEIKVERQSGGWVWAAVLHGASGGEPVVLRQSPEAFPTEDDARQDAGLVVSALSGKSGQWVDESKE
ncbi:hypothetical protein [Caballeronia sp. LZ016]|uniref:hypothetical protein n=1 Tax=Caballeronia sp. LZ016 TaxID=3038554 RepID=UPI00285E48EB|nr:hypothetical protein [Caballeronia sp. LZ016]MDR5740203.1 hypothetical protein [Caballeronia sp. LZ016]